MRKISSLIVIFVSLVACRQDRIAFVDNSVIINEYEEKKAMEALMKTKIETFNKKRDSISSAFQLEYGEAGEKSKKMSQRAAQEMAQKLNEKGQFLGQQLQMEEQQLQAESQSKMDTVLSKIKEFVKVYGKNNNYTYILGANEAGSVLYGDTTRDITQEVLKALNENYTQ